MADTKYKFRYGWTIISDSIFRDDEKLLLEFLRITGKKTEYAHKVA